MVLATIWLCDVSRDLSERHYDAQATNNNLKCYKCGLQTHINKISRRISTDHYL